SISIAKATERSTATPSARSHAEAQGRSHLGAIIAPSTVSTTIGITCPASRCCGSPDGQNTNTATPAHAPAHAPIAAARLCVATGTARRMARDEEARESSVAAQLERGRYLVKIAGCNDCHTQDYASKAGAVSESQWLTGSDVGWE